ncbi:hypothetical protein CYMTET_25510 [Cymbomonas tetramitiformis]|uniref:Uncharacterized protein n=1 Tax=Cymbomonas tetramitiformis TaxID=36881 RepID=A0AAE0FUE0_9CHLO|nr:hypothetical protein CYMTET_25510 [Cymbomonas tetramitiformis]
MGERMGRAWRHAHLELSLRRHNGRKNGRAWRHAHLELSSPKVASALEKKPTTSTSWPSGVTATPLRSPHSSAPLASPSTAAALKAKSQRATPSRRTGQKGGVRLWNAERALSKATGVLSIPTRSMHVEHPEGERDAAPRQRPSEGRLSPEVVGMRRVEVSLKGKRKGGSTSPINRIGRIWQRGKPPLAATKAAEKTAVLGRKAARLRSKDTSPSEMHGCGFKGLCEARVVRSSHLPSSGDSPPAAVTHTTVPRLETFITKTSSSWRSRKVPFTSK